MIISHKHRFIFIKTAKTSGTSMEIALSKYCGEQDIITPLSAQDERIRRELGYRGPQNYHVAAGKYGKLDWARRLFQGKRLAFYNHIGAQAIRRFVGDAVWQDYFSFCFERNPWDKVISYYHHYYWQFPDRPRVSLAEFIQSGLANSLVGLGFELYSAHGEILVDRVCLYENLDRELDFVTNRLNLRDRPQLPHAKGHVRKDRRHYREVLTDQDKKKIAKLFAREIAYFGYEY